MNHDILARLYYSSSTAVYAFMENLFAKDFPGLFTTYGDYIVHASRYCTKFIYWSWRSDRTVQLHIFAKQNKS